MDNLHVRFCSLCPDQDLVYHHSSKEHLKMNEIAKFGSCMLLITKNMAQQSLRILCIFVSYHF